MKVENDKVRILLPTYNKKQLIQKTLDSIKAQTYDEENIEVIIVDFGSDVDTYEWLFEYPLKHIAIYRKNPRTRESLDYFILNRLSTMSLRLHNEYVVELQPGDVLYPDFISKCVNLMVKYKAKEVKGIICEAILDQGSGVLKKQKPLFSNDRIIAREDRLEYLTRGAAHRIIYFDKRKGMGAGANFDGWHYYDPHYWTYRFTQGNNENMLYLYEPAGIINTETINTSNMLQKMIATYVSILQFIRTYEYSNTDSISIEEQLQIYINFAYLSLIMACECGKQRDDKAAEDCCLFSKVIWLPISDTVIYNKLFNMLGDNNQNAWEQMINDIIAEREGTK